jgi:hypothetical protein
MAVEGRIMLGSRFFCFVLVAVALAAAVAACSGSSSSTLGDGGAHTMCVPGASVACVGAGGCAGGQVCSLDGTHYGSCDCSAGGPDAASDATTPDMDATTPGMDATTPGMEASTSGDASAKDSGLFGGDAGCTPGLTCNVGCAGGATTTITGTVYDPAGKNPVYDVVVYVPAAPLPPLPKGVPAGAAACSCPALFPSAVLANAKTVSDGRFVLKNVPAGSNVPLVMQIGKWRRLVHVNVTACQDNPQPAGSLTLPSTVAPGSDDNIPDIAVSTGGADTLECLLRRVGLAASEYVAGAATTGHVHMFSGGTTDILTNPNVGQAESAPFPGAPASPTGLWATAQQLLPYDITLLSCEGAETYQANPPALEGYLNAGGRVLASHYHYAWFNGPTLSMQTYAAPMDWGSKLATWTPEGSSTAPVGPIGGILDTTLNGSVSPFPKGVAFKQWLTFQNVLTDGGVPGGDGGTIGAGELPIYQPRFDAVVGPTDTASQAWITSDATGMAGQTMLFSFNTPVAAGQAASCGRAMFSDIHAEGNPVTVDTPPAPGGCASVDLSPQEKALEFALFDLSGCVVPDSANP